MKTKYSYIYFITNNTNTTLYIGVTSDLVKRIYEHRNKLVQGFSYKYIQEAILREKRLKKWNRKWKNELVEKTNPEWKDLYEELL